MQIYAREVISTTRLRSELIYKPVYEYRPMYEDRLTTNTTHSGIGYSELVRPDGIVL